MRSADAVVMGHEFVGEVVSYGPGCRKRWKPGTRICALPIIMHGGDVEMVGLAQQAPGAFAEYIEVSEALAMPVPDDVSDEDAALTEPLAVAHHAVRRSGIGKRDVAVVIGCGPIGLSVIMLLKAAGVKTVVASDLSQGRRALAARCGADKVVDPTQESPYSAVKQQQKHFTDAPALFGEAFKALKALQTIPGVPWRHIVRLASDAGLTPAARGLRVRRRARHDRLDHPRLAAALAGRRGRCLHGGRHHPPGAGHQQRRSTCGSSSATTRTNSPRSCTSCTRGPLIRPC